jgi:hypothetical protein
MHAPNGTAPNATTWVFVTLVRDLLSSIAQEEDHVVDMVLPAC